MPSKLSVMRTIQHSTSLPFMIFALGSILILRNVEY
jgi:hypothetical protein